MFPFYLSFPFFVLHSLYMYFYCFQFMPKILQDFYFPKRFGISSANNATKDKGIGDPFAMIDCLHSRFKTPNVSFVYISTAAAFLLLKVLLITLKDSTH